MKIFADKDEWITQHNSEERNYVVGHNHFSTWSDEEYKGILTLKPVPEDEKVYTDLPLNDINSNIDWRAKGKVTGVKN